MKKTMTMLLGLGLAAASLLALAQTTAVMLDLDLIEQKGLLLETRIAPGVSIQGDETLLSKVLDNVLINAILYSPTGANILVEVRGASFSVENSGVQIPEASLGQLFTPFYRVEQSRNRKSGGSGLGLYLVQSILDLHGATCAMENTARGVRFHAHFPAEPLPVDLTKASEDSILGEADFPQNHV